MSTIFIPTAPTKIVGPTGGIIAQLMPCAGGFTMILQNDVVTNVEIDGKEYKTDTQGTYMRPELIKITVN
jgi:hypothetical protein